MWSFERLRRWIEERAAANQRARARLRSGGNRSSRAGRGFDFRSALMQFETLEPRQMLSIASVSIGNATVVEPASGSVNMNFPVTRTGGDLTQPLSVGWQTVAGTATLGNDFSATTGTVTFAANSTTATIVIPILANANTTVQAFSVKLTGVSGGFPAGPSVGLGANVNFPMSGTNPFALALGDFNGDGKRDVAVTGTSNATVSVFLNNTTPGSAPSFTSAFTFSTGSFPESVAVGDMNHDGKVDLIVGNYLGASVSVLLNTTTSGSFSASFAGKQDFTVGSNPLGVDVGDVNHDGNLDIVTSNFVPNNVSVLLNTTPSGSATATFSTHQEFSTDNGTNPNSSPNAVKFGDINNDGLLDIVTSNRDNDTAGVLLNTTAPNASSPSFATVVSFAVGDFPDGLALGDLNGDGRVDIVTSNRVADTVSILFNTTNGGAATPTFAAKQDFVSGPSSFQDAPAGIVVGDLNGDGRADVAVTNFFSYNVSVLVNKTAPGSTTAAFATRQDFAGGSGNATFSLALGDLNGDGKPELVSTSDTSSSDGISVFLNTTTLPTPAVALASASNFTGAGSAKNYAVVTGDVNGDGKSDVVVANSDINTVTVLLNGTLHGSSSPSLNYLGSTADFPVGTSPSDVKLCDVNCDGRPDIVVTNRADNTLSVLLNTTNLGEVIPTFAAKQDFAVGLSPISVNVGDLNGDGKLDLAVVNTNANTVSVLLNTTTPGGATPSFANKQDVAVGSQPSSVCVGDLNGDGKLDLAVLNYSDDTVSVLINATAPGASTANFVGKQDFTLAHSPSSIAIGDLNGDGRADLVATNYGVGINSVSVLLNTTTPGSNTAAFATKQDFATGISPLSVTVRDLDGDGRLDLITANTGTNAANGSVSILLNVTVPGSSTISFGTLQSPLTGTMSRSVAIADLNADGKPDAIVVGKLGTKNIAVLMNAQATITVGTGTGTITVAGPPANVAPVLDASKSTALVNQVLNLAAPANGSAVGTLVSALVHLNGTLKNVTDANTSIGIALTQVDLAHGSWYYSLDNGGHWLPMLVVADTGARLLAADAATRLYFKPNAGFVGTIAQAITFRAWDRTSGTNGAKVTTATNGGSTAFSTATDTASITITNTAPVLDTTKSPTLTSISRTSTAAPSGAVGTLIDNLVRLTGSLKNVTDPDAGALTGIAITLADMTKGAWWFSTNNGTSWTKLVSASTSAALLLAADGQTRLYFQPKSGTPAGTIAAAITFRAWDRTNGTNGRSFNVGAGGLATPFSRLGDTASIAVT